MQSVYVLREHYHAGLFGGINTKTNKQTRAYSGTHVVISKYGLLNFLMLVIFNYVCVGPCAVTGRM